MKHCAVCNSEQYLIERLCHKCAVESLALKSKQLEEQEVRMGNHLNAMKMLRSTLCEDAVEEPMQVANASVEYALALLADLRSVEAFVLSMQRGIFGTSDKTLYQTTVQTEDLVKHLRNGILQRESERDAAARNYTTLFMQVKDLADTVDQGLNVSNEGKGPMERLSAQVAALLQCYIQERIRNTVQCESTDGSDT